MFTTALAVAFIAAGIDSDTRPSVSGDFDGDGTTDVFTVKTYEGRPGRWLVSYSKPDGGSVGWRQRGGDRSVSIHDMRFGDFDGDGTTDIFTVKTYEGRRRRWLVSYSKPDGGSVGWRPRGGDAAHSIHDLRFGDFHPDDRPGFYFGDSRSLVWANERRSLRPATGYRWKNVTGSQTGLESRRLSSAIQLLPSWDMGVRHPAFPQLRASGQSAVGLGMAWGCD